MSSGNVWMQVKRGKNWENLFSIPQGMIDQYTTTLSERFGKDNVRVSPEAKRQLVAECCCRDTGETMALCPRHAREWDRREKELRDAIAEEVGSYKKTLHEKFAGVLSEVIKRVRVARHA